MLAWGLSVVCRCARDATALALLCGVCVCVFVLCRYIYNQRQCGFCKGPVKVWDMAGRTVRVWRVAWCVAHSCVATQLLYARAVKLHHGMSADALPTLLCTAGVLLRGVPAAAPADSRCRRQQQQQQAGPQGRCRSSRTCSTCCSRPAEPRAPQEHGGSACCRGEGSHLSATSDDCV